MSGWPALGSTERSQESVWNLSLSAITDAVSVGSGAPYSSTALFMSAMITPIANQAFGRHPRKRVAFRNDITGGAFVGKQTHRTAVSTTRQEIG